MCFRSKKVARRQSVYQYLGLHVFELLLLVRYELFQQVGYLCPLCILRLRDWEDVSLEEAQSELVI